MSKNKFAIMWEDENALVSEFYDSPDDAIKGFEVECGMNWSDDGMANAHYVREFTPNEVIESESWSEI